MSKFRMPTAYTILLGIILIMILLTRIIPAGQYNYTGDGQPVAGSYHRVEQNAQPLSALFRAPIEGLYEAIDIAVFILTVGGFLGVMAKTGAIDAGIARIIRRLKGRETLLIPILMCAFALGGTTFGMSEETIAFYPLVLPIMIAAGYDNITAVATILLGAGVGTLGSTVNPFATGIASGFAGISLGSGILLRLILLTVLLGAAIWFVMAYAARVKGDHSRSLMADRRSEYIAHFSTLDQQEDKPLSGKQRIALAVFALTFLVMIWSVIPFQDMGLPLPTLGWWFPELSALFFGASVLLGLLCRLKEADIAGSFVSGAAELLGVSFIIGLSRGITVVMNAGRITDTVLNTGERLLTGIGTLPFVLLIYLIYLPLSFLIPSSSGLAALSMPIMAPLADFSGTDRALVITAFQSASGLINLITPTSAVVMGALAIGRIPYERWLKFVWKLILILLGGSLALLAAGALL